MGGGRTPLHLYGDFLTVDIIHINLTTSVGPQPHNVFHQNMNMNGIHAMRKTYIRLQKNVLPIENSYETVSNIVNVQHFAIIFLQR